MFINSPVHRCVRRLSLDISDTQTYDVQQEACLLWSSELRYWYAPFNVKLPFVLCKTTRKCLYTVNATYSVVVLINLLKPNGYLRTTNFNLKKFYVVLTLRVIVCMDFYPAKH